MNRRIGVALGLVAGVAMLCSYAVGAQTAPRYMFDPDWPKPLPNKWKIGGVTGLAVDKDDNVWVLNRPNDLHGPRAPGRALPRDLPIAASGRRR